MIRLVAVAGFALSLAVSAQAMTPAPTVIQPDGMITKSLACGPGMTRVNGVCVAVRRSSCPPSRPQMRDRNDLLVVVLQRHSEFVGKATGHRHFWYKQAKRLRRRDDNAASVHYLPPVVI